MNWKLLARTAPAVTATAILGGLGTKPDSSWYRGLAKPSWEPLPVAFPVVWTTLYAAIAAASARAMDRQTPSERRAYERALWVNLGLNAGWCWLFFTAQRPRLAMTELVVLELSTLDLTRRAGAVDPAAAAVLAPYAAWNAFAGALNAAIVARNPR